MLEFAFDSTIIKWEGKAAWHFVPVPEDTTDEIDAFCDDQKAGFGSIRVRARIGSSKWDTSIFPDKSQGMYMLPLKKAVRAAEDIGEGDPVHVELSVAMR